MADRSRSVAGGEPAGGRHTRENQIRETGDGVAATAAARRLGAGLRRWRSLPLILGITIAGSYAFFAALAAVRFPHAYGPWQDNTLSQLGNPNLNPDGYILYLVGCAVAGIFAIAFFLSLCRWRVSGTRNQNRLLLLVQVLGGVGGFALFMNAIFPENEYVQHHFWAGLVFNSFATATLLAIPALWRVDRSNSGLIAFNVVAFAAVILMYVFAPVHWVEWLPAGMFLLLPLLLGVLTRTLEHEARDLRA